MGAFTTTGKNTLLDNGLPATIYAALHSGAPGATGADNELSGGSPAYARKAVSFGAAAAGARALSAAVLFDVPAGATVSYMSLWTAATGGSCVFIDDVTSETFAAQGQYQLNSLTLSGTD